MFKIKIKEEEKVCLIHIGGFVTKENIDEFLAEYKENVKQIKTAQYALIIEPRDFKTDSEEMIKNSFRRFLKTGFKSIIIVDKDFMQENIKLSKLERKFFFSRVKVVSSIEEAFANKP